MALHIRDFRQSDTAQLSRLCETGQLIGAQPRDGDGARIFSGLREDRLAAAIWFKLEGQTGIIHAIALASSNLWQSDVQELIAEASLWLASRGAVRIELRAIPEDSALLGGIREMHFRSDERTGTMHRLIPAHSAA